jgi:hypothetical protein
MDTLLKRSALAFALLASGCASFNSLSPGMSAQRVEGAVGAPSNVWKSPDGSEVWEYPLGPLGVETYMVSFGPDRSVRGVRQVLTDENINKLQPGMSRDDVNRMLGRPAGKGFSDRTNEEIWYWRYMAWQVRKMELYVQFDRPTGTLKTFQRHQLDASDSKRN